MKVVFAKHPASPKEFLFMVPDDMKSPERDDVMLVDTMYGETIAVASSDVIEIDRVDELVNRCGAYLPLKKVLAVCSKALRDYIERELRKSIAQSITSIAETPFVSTTRIAGDTGGYGDYDSDYWY